MSEQSAWPESVNYALRTAQQHHVQLSMMADQKANMLLGATFVVFTLAIGQARSGEQTLALVVIAVSAFISALLAAMAVMPMTRPRPGGTKNWLFFGAFQSLGEDEYIAKMLGEEFATSEAVYTAMLRDLHQMGLVLARKKYRYLTYAYRVFLAGLTLTFAVFVTEQMAGPLI